MNETHTVEGRVMVTSGSTICPHPLLCDWDEGESYEAYVTRHLGDHEIATSHKDTGVVFDYFSAFEEGGNLGLEARERNLAVWCLFYYAKHIQGNKSLGTGKLIIADYEPCWEDAEFLANNTFHPDDLEQHTEWKQRTFHLKPFAERRKDGAVYKRKKKLTKVRGTQKTSWVKAFITWKHLRAFFLFKNPTLRVLCISANKGVARDNYFEPLKTLWESNENLRRLFGQTVYTQRHGMLLKKRAKGLLVSDDDLRGETRELCLLSRGSKSSIDRMRLRWNVGDKDASGQTAVSLCCAGANTGTQGGRWDIVVLDDIVDRKNSRTKNQRDKIIGVVAELRNQARGATAEIVYANTPQMIGDASEIIDKKHDDEYHIMYRPAMWYDTQTKEPHYYWQRSAPTDIFPDGEELWTPKAIDEKRKDADFWSQQMLRLRDESGVLFKREDFSIIEAADAPIEVRAGLGGATLSDRDAARFERDGLRRRRITFIDPAGEEERANGDDTAEITWAFDQFGDLYMTHISGGRLNPAEECDLIYDAWAYSDSELVEFEVDSALVKYVRSTHSDYQRRKALELGQPITIPIVYQPASRSKLSKGERMDRMYSYTSTGRVKILRNAGPLHLIELFIEQYVERGNTPHDDFADAGSRVVPHASRAPRREKPKVVQTAQPTNAPASARVNIADMLALLNQTESQPANWGARR